MRNKDRRLTAANTFWALDALTVVLLGLRLYGETFYVYSHAEHAEQSREYWLTAGEILLDYLPILLCLTAAALFLTVSALRARKKSADAPQVISGGAEIPDDEAAAANTGGSSDP